MKTGPKRTFLVTAEELAVLYKTKSMAEIARHFGVGPTVVFNRLKEYGIRKVGADSGHRKKTGRVFSAEHRKKISQAKRGVYVGENNPNWQGGISKHRKLKRNSHEYKEWRKAVFERDGFVCQVCGVHGSGDTRFKGLHAHHKITFSQDPTKAFDVDNGMVVCQPCHSDIHGWNVESPRKTG